MNNFTPLLKTGPLTDAHIDTFREMVYAHYRGFGRDLPWRSTHDPYAIFVSEVMLQQTQVERVISKYDQFLDRFPDFPALAHAPFDQVLSVWKGLGYNRRALALQRAADSVVTRHGGVLPDSMAALRSLPGVGPATAGALMAFAHEKPAVFIETNIRRVFLHFFFADRARVKDREILPLVERTLDCGHVRKWYYALMDYGVALKRTDGNPNRRSAHYHRQSRFEGSDRQIRGRILEALLEHAELTDGEIADRLDGDSGRILRIVDTLVNERLLHRTGRRVRIASRLHEPAGE